MLGISAMNGATMTGRSPARTTRDYGSWHPDDKYWMKPMNLFEEYDLNMQSILNRIHFRGLFEPGDVALVDVPQVP